MNAWWELSLEIDRQAECNQDWWDSDEGRAALSLVARENERLKRLLSSGETPTKTGTAEKGGAN